MLKRDFIEYLEKLTWRLCTTEYRLCERNPQLAPLFRYCKNEEGKMDKGDRSTFIPLEMIETLRDFAYDVREDIDSSFSDTEKTDIAIIDYLNLANGAVKPSLFEKKVKHSANIWLFGRTTQQILEDIIIACNDTLDKISDHIFMEGFSEGVQTIINSYTEIISSSNSATETLGELNESTN